ncbi:MAG: hypothetical protein GX945_12030 [Lentisphaerae bacterium]|nr:hypothetical protein [Lentisphaerota bacterium]
MLEYFPTESSRSDETGSVTNPSLLLYGKRLYKDQSPCEFLVELLLLVFSPKKVNDGDVVSDALPPLTSDACSWTKLQYSPKARLNLKLFSFLGASQLETRHASHREHYQELVDNLKSCIDINGASQEEDVVRTLTNLFMGFQGAGGGRTWCAQSFLPVSPAFLAGETIWSESKAKKLSSQNWCDLLSNLSSVFNMTQHLFLARGGELLYLQVCNALRQSSESIGQWCDGDDLGFTDNERDPAWLRESLNQAFGQLREKSCPKTLTEIAELIDVGLEDETASYTDIDRKDQANRYVEAGYCNADSWREGYLFAVELRRLLTAKLDIMDRLALLETACCMQVLRALASQSARVTKQADAPDTGLGYLLALSAPDEVQPAVRRLSQQSVKDIRKMIFASLRVEEILDEVKASAEHASGKQKSLESIYKNADDAYGWKLFTSLAKRIGLIVPKRSAGARFVLNEQLLRYLVVTIVPHNGRLTYDTFKKQLKSRHGLVLDAVGLNKANLESKKQGLHLPADIDKWLLTMLEGAGFLVQLSDSCALVHNPIDNGGDGK